ETCSVSVPGCTSLVGSGCTGLLLLLLRLNRAAPGLPVAAVLPAHPRPRRLADFSPYSLPLWLPSPSSPYLALLGGEQRHRDRGSVCNRKRSRRRRRRRRGGGGGAGGGGAVRPAVRDPNVGAASSQRRVHSTFTQPDRKAVTVRMWDTPHVLLTPPPCHNLDDIT
ncbi:hypothetical protein INR49_007783, partial [Caranx melampygus]